MALGLRIVVDRQVWSSGFCGFFFFFCCDWCLKELGMAFCYWFDLILGWIFLCGFMVVELGVAMVWFDFDFVGCHGCQSWGLLLLLV